MSELGSSILQPSTYRHCCSRHPKKPIKKRRITKVVVKVGGITETLPAVWEWEIDIPVASGNSANLSMKISSISFYRN